MSRIKAEIYLTSRQNLFILRCGEKWCCGCTPQSCAGMDALTGWLSYLQVALCLYPSICKDISFRNWAKTGESLESADLPYTTMLLHVQG